MPTVDPTPTPLLFIAVLLRFSDFEREQVAEWLRQDAGEGRLIPASKEWM